MAFVTFIDLNERVLCVNTSIIQFIRPAIDGDWNTGAVLVLREQINVGDGVRLTSFELNPFQAQSLLQELDKVV